MFKLVNGNLSVSIINTCDKHFWKKEMLHIIRDEHDQACTGKIDTQIFMWD